MIDIKHMDKEAVYDIMLDLLYSVNVGHSKLGNQLKEIYSSLDKTPEFNKLVSKINGDAGRYEAKRLLKTLGIKGTDIDLMIAILEHSHWSVFENIQVTKLTDKHFIMKTIDCSRQKASKRRGDEYTDCTIGASLSCRQGFFSEINSSARVKKVFAPPEQKPPIIDGNVSCAWEISID